MATIVTRHGSELTAPQNQTDFSNLFRKKNVVKKGFEILLEKRSFFFFSPYFKPNSTGSLGFRDGGPGPLKCVRNSKNVFLFAHKSWLLISVGRILVLVLRENIYASRGAIS